MNKLWWKAQLAAFFAAKRMEAYATPEGVDVHMPTTFGEKRVSIPPDFSFEAWRRKYLDEWEPADGIIFVLLFVGAALLTSSAGRAFSAGTWWLKLIAAISFFVLTLFTLLYLSFGIKTHISGGAEWRGLAGKIDSLALLSLPLTRDNIYAAPCAVLFERSSVWTHALLAAWWIWFWGAFASGIVSGDVHHALFIAAGLTQGLSGICAANAAIPSIIKLCALPGALVAMILDRLIFIRPPKPEQITAAWLTFEISERAERALQQ